MKAVRVIVSGRVQGVGFRYWTEEQADRRGLDGWVRNLTDGRVEAVFSGREAQIDDMIAACNRGPRFAHVTGVEVFEPGERVARGFRTLPTGF